MQRILVVDDEHLVADTLTLILRKSGFETWVAYSADEAIASARIFSPEMVLCDITMPGRSGIDLMEDIRRELPNCSILVLTGYMSNLKRVRLQALKMPLPTGILTKPCPPAELLRQTGVILARA